MSKVLNGPIPGQSLTDEPGNYPWERPPETADPAEALSMYLKKMSKPKFMDSALYMMELGVPAEVVTNTTITMAIGNGIHSIDVGLIIAPAIHKEVVSIAQMAGIEYDEYFPDDESDEQDAKDRVKDIVIAKLRRSQPKGEAKISETMEAMTSPETEEFEDMRESKEVAVEEEEMTPDNEMAMDKPTQEPPSDMGKGLMSKGV